MTEAGLLDSIKHKLGEPIVKVELNSTHYDHAIIGAKDWFLANKGVIGTKAMSISGTSGVKFNVIDPTYGVDAVIDVYFNVDPSVGGLFNDTVFGVFTNGFPILEGSFWRMGTQINYSAYVQWMMSIQERKRLVGSEYDWFVEEDSFDGNYTLYVDGTNSSVGCVVKYKPRLSSAQFQLSWLKAKDADLVEEYAIANAQEYLGLIRSKYSDYSVPGGSVSMNGDVLLQEASEAKERLNVEIAGSQGPMGFTRG